MPPSVKSIRALPAARLLGVTLEWDESVDPSVTHYLLFSGTNSVTQFTNTLPKTNRATANILSASTWFFGVKAGNSNAVSDMSNIAVWPLTNFYFRNTVQTSALPTGPWVRDARWAGVNITNPPAALFERVVVERVYY